MTLTTADVNTLIDAKLSAQTTGGVVDTFWLMICGMLVFFMQCGFALLEAGTVRAKNTKNILLKNLLDACVGCLIWYMFGMMIALDAGDGFIGGTETKGASPSFFMQGAHNPGVETENPTGYTFALWFFQFCFAAAAATIVSGAMAERTSLGAYLAYTLCITGFIYPVVVHWVWSTDGWLSSFNDNKAVNAAQGTSKAEPFMGGMMDFAGSGVVHMTGGVAAFWGALIVKPRKGRFEGPKKKPVPMPGHSTTLQVMGTFILWLGWYGFNPGSTLGLSATNYARDAARCVVTTTLSAATCGLTVALLEKVLGDKTWSVSAVCNGILGGLVSITAGCSAIYPWAAIIIGCIGGFVYFGSSKLVLHKLKVDDPLDAFAVHGACGFWGTLAVGFFAAPQYCYSKAPADALGTVQCAGAFYGQGNAIGAAIVGLLAEIAWVSAWSILMFTALKLIGILRVSAEVEDAGMDVSKHGGAAYPDGGMANVESTPSTKVAVDSGA